MKPSVKAFLAILALFASLLTGSNAAQATTASFKEGTDLAAKFFDPLAVSSISISHYPGTPTLNILYLDSQTYRQANITITLPGAKPVTLTNVGIRLKGQASRYDRKYPMKVKFDAFVKGQKFLGLRRVTLNNMVQDPSFIHEVTAYKLYRSAGVPAPRASYAKVTVEGQYMGLYLNIESIDKEFGNRWFPSTAHIYSGPYNCDVVPGNTCYEAGIGDTNRSDLNTAGAASTLHGEQWWNAINQVANMDNVIRLMATDVFLSNWDGYTDAVENNHFVHFDDTGKLSIVPWGLDQTFTSDPNAYLTWDGTGAIYRNWSDHRSTMFDHCVEYAPCFTEYLKQGARISALATSLHLAEYMTTIADKIDPIIAGTPDLHTTSLTALHSFQSWIPTFLTMRQGVLSNYFAGHSPREVAVSIPSEVHVGQVIKVTIPPIWEPGVIAHIQWLLDGYPIDNQTQVSHTITAAEVNHELSASVSLSRNNVGDTTVQTGAYVVLAKLLSKTPTPTISGTAKVNSTLKAVSGKWDSGVSLSYQWLRGDTEISGATATNYRLTADDRGQQISVRITGTKANFATSVKTSRKTLSVR